MALERKILSIAKPTIQIDKIEGLNFESKDSAVKVADNLTHQAGGLYPLIEINKYKFTSNEIVSLKIDETGFIPQVSVTFANSDGLFISTSFPKDGDPLSVFIRSKKEEFKPIRADFDISFVSSTSSTASDGETSLIVFNGLLRVPGLYAEHCKSFQKKTSMDTLMDVAKELGLGFASNETATNDKMTWLCPFDTYEKFIKDITAASYKDDDSFYKAFIDKYYYLNFVNVNNQFSEEQEVEKAIELMEEGHDYHGNHKVEPFETKLLLTNNQNAQGTGNHIISYSLQNNAGQVVMENGYRRYLQFYDAFFSSGNTPEKKYQSHFVEPLHTPGLKDKIILRGRKGENIVENTSKYKWLGIQFGLPDGNAHENYLYSIIQNWQNNQEIEKLLLHVTLGQCNFNIYRGMRLPVVIINNGSQIRMAATRDEGQDSNTRLTYDRFLSGYYYVAGMKYTWKSDDQKFRQDLILTRREWPFPANNSIPDPSSTTNANI